MLIMAIIGALTPTLFYQMFGSVNNNIFFIHHTAIAAAQLNIKLNELFHIVAKISRLIFFIFIFSLNFDALGALTLRNLLVVEVLHVHVVIMIK